MTPEASRPPGPGRAGLCLAIGILAIAAAGLAHDRAPALIGLARDDGEYVAYARALLEGQGYVDPTALDAGPARRFPIGFPALLAAAMAGAEGWPAMAARAMAVGPIALAAYVGLVAVALARWTSLPGWGVVAATAVIALHPDVLYLASLPLSDVPAAALALGALLAAEAVGGAWAVGSGGVLAGLAAGTLAGAATLCRYAGVAFAAAIAFGWARSLRSPAHPTAIAGALAFAAVLAPWALYRAGLGGERYASELGAFLGSALGAEAIIGTAWRVVANGMGGWLLPPATTADPGPLGVLALGAGAVALYGLPRARAAAPALAATLAIAAAWLVAYLWTERTLATRLTLPVAPAVWAAFLAGGAALLAREPALAARARPWLPALFVLPLASTAIGLVRGPAVSKEVHAAVATEHQALFAAIARVVPADGRVMAPLPAPIWLYAGRRAAGYPAAIAGGRERGPTPEALRAALRAQRIGWLVATPPLYADVDVVASAVLPLMAARPGALVPAWRNARGDYALLRVDPRLLDDRPVGGSESRIAAIPASGPAPSRPPAF